MGIAGFPTAFKAVYTKGIGGPTIGVLCEYDALRGLGHGCGHHMQGPGCIGAAIALKNVCTDASYTIIVYGTPAEETLGAKCAMLQQGCFKELDVAFMMHGAMMEMRKMMQLMKSPLKSVLIIKYSAVFL